jgi:hypothetical protein
MSVCTSRERLSPTRPSARGACGGRDFKPAAVFIALAELDKFEANAELG